MTPIERRALYNLLRMNWLEEPALQVELWQVEDYMSLPLSDLLEQLKQLNIHLDRISFISHAEECDSPEDLTNYLLGDNQVSIQEEDKVYLLIFELWRRLMNDKPSLSILCYELDHQMYLYDHGQYDLLALQDAVTHFLQILDDNVDQGVLPEQAFELVSSYCANDVEDFLYDFIAKQIDDGNESYAQELLDDFNQYWKNNKWFKLLHIRLCEPIYSKLAQKMISEINEEYLNDQDLAYSLEYLNILAQTGDSLNFKYVLKSTLDLIKTEEDFQDVLAITIDYFHRLDQVNHEIILQEILEKRPEDTNRIIHSNDPSLQELVRLF